MKFKILLFHIMLFLLLALHRGAVGAPAPALDASHRTRAEQAFLKLPLRFEENAGNFDATVRYLARGHGYTLFLASGESVLTVCRETQKKNKSRRPKSASDSLVRNAVVRLRLENGNESATLQGESRLSAPTNYLVGNDPSKWCAASNYERVRVESVYPGIDMLYYGQMRGLEYDFEVAPGADPKRIAVRYDGVRSLRVEADGSLVSQLKGGGELRQNRPVSYQMIHGQRREVSSRYAVREKNTVTFELGDYDSSEPLLIDPPVLSYSTYLGGTIVDSAHAIAVDQNGLVYITGVAGSANFPTVGQYQTTQGFNDVFVAKLNPSLVGAASLLYATYLGGSDNEDGDAIAVDSSGNVFITGNTDSTNFPVLNQYQNDRTGTDAFVTKLNTNATGAASLVYSTYLGGNGADFGKGIGIGSGGNVFVTGYTESTNFPTLNEYQPDQGLADVFVTKINPSLSGAASLLYSTYLGGSTEDYGYAIAVDGNFAYVTGFTTSTDYPTLNQYQSDQGSSDVVVTKLNPSLSGAASLIYSTYLGGIGVDVGTGIAADSGKAYVTGYTFSSDFPTLNPYQTNQPDVDAFVTKLDTRLSGASSRLYSTYVGGDGLDRGQAIAVNAAGNVFITGYTQSTNFPTLDPIQTDQPGDDAFVTKLSTTTTGAAALLFSTYLGGNANDQGLGIGIGSGDIYITGYTDSTDFTLLNQYQGDQGSRDAFVTKFTGGFQLLAAVSRKTHSGVDYDIDLPLTGEPGVECRSGGGAGVHTIIFTFTNTVTGLDASITSGAGDITSPPALSGSTVTISLGSVIDIQKLRIHLSNVSASGGGMIPSADLDINFLTGDTSGNKTVNSTDIGQTKLQSGGLVTAANFRSDLNANGSINATDVGIVKLSSGHGVP